jgi:carbonic anhydrase
VSPQGAGSIEYAAEHLGSRLIVVMGHTKCGAVKAASGTGGGHLSANIQSLVDDIKPAVERARAMNAGATDDEVLTASIRENVWESVFDLLKTSPSLCEMARKGEVKIVGAVCDISNGKVSFMGEHPWQNQLLAAMSGKPAATADAAKPGEGH